MTKKDIKAFFQAIRNSDIETVSKLVCNDKTYLTVTNFSPPKKDDGQSGLQVAFKTSNFEIAEFLINNGADVNFQEKSEINEWTAPVLHDCIRATIFNCQTTDKNETSEFNRAFELLQLMLSKNADPNSVDSYGNNCLHRAYLDAGQVIDNDYYEQNEALNQIRKVFKQLIEAGANPKLSNDDRESLIEMIKEEQMEKYNLI